jgi:hypothetical protein
VTQVKYGKIKDIEEGEGLEDAIIAAFLMEKMSAGQEKNGALLSLLTNDPVQIGAMLNKGLLEMKKRGVEGEKFARAANRAIEQVGQFLEKNIEGKEKHRNIMTQIMFAIKPEVQAAVYQARVAHTDHPNDSYIIFIGGTRDGGKII